MGQWKNPILLGDPEIIACVILVVMRIDDGIDARKLITGLQKPLPAVLKSCVNQKPVYIIGKNLEEGEAKKLARHVN
jgi:hypothetical protein